jgi:hypothetical protein
MSHRWLRILKFRSEPSRLQGACASRAQAPPSADDRQAGKRYKPFVKAEINQFCDEESNQGKKRSGPYQQADAAQVNQLENFARIRSAATASLGATILSADSALVIAMYILTCLRSWITLRSVTITAGRSRPLKRRKVSSTISLSALMQAPNFQDSDVQLARAASPPYIRRTARPRSTARTNPSSVSI